MLFDNSYVAIDLDRILENFKAIQKKAGVPVMAVIKADAYGHGAVPIARLLEPHCAFFGVSSVQEALELRNAGLNRTPILVLGQTPAAAFPQILREGIRPGIFSWEDALALSAEAVRQNCIAPFHFVLDTGMSRLGFQATPEAAELCAQIAVLPNLRAEGLFSHFATADCGDLTRSQAQKACFDDFYALLREKGVDISLVHLDNSAGLMNFSSHYSMVRAGIVIYGMYPSAEIDPSLLKLTPALSWHSRVSHLKTLPAGREISYGGTCVTTRPTVVATIPVGYGDGYRRNLSNRFYVLIRGRRAPILGRICMDQLMVDVTDIPGASLSDPVVLIGRDGQEEITVEQIAACADSFNYEFVCGISRRNPRFYYQGGKLVRQVHYLLDR